MKETKQLDFQIEGASISFDVKEGGEVEWGPMIGSIAASLKRLADAAEELNRIERDRLKLGSS